MLFTQEFRAGIVALHILESPRQRVGFLFGERNNRIGESRENFVTFKK